MAYSVPPNSAVLQAPVTAQRAGLRLHALAGGLLLVGLSCAGFASAQIDPDDTGAGDKLGLTQQNNSGQVGTVTLFPRGRPRALVVIDLPSEPAGRAQPARIERGRSCERRAARAAFGLAPVVNGTSRTLVPAAAAKLLSGNYVLAVYAWTRSGARRVSCGQLYR